MCKQKNVQLLTRYTYTLSFSQILWKDVLFCLVILCQYLFFVHIFLVTNQYDRAHCTVKTKLNMKTNMKKINPSSFHVIHTQMFYYTNFLTLSISNTHYISFLRVFVIESMIIFFLFTRWLSIEAPQQVSTNQ